MISWRYKILSLFLVPVIFFSFSGIVFHFHYCESRDKLYADFHLPASGSDIAECGTIELMHSKCCDHHPVHNYIVDANHLQCCIDVTTLVKTDKQYLFQDFELNFSLLPIELDFPFYTYKPESQKFPFILNTDFIPPDILSTVVLLL